FWNTAVVKRSGDVTRLQALVGKKRILIFEEVVCKILQLNDVEGAFFSTQWKFFIHTILHSLSAKRTSWNEFSSAMASALICLSSGQRFNFSKYIFESLVRNVDSTSKFYMYPRVGKGFSGVETPLFETMLVVRDVDAEEEVQVPAKDDVVQEHVIEEIATEVVPPTPTSPSPSSPVIPSTSPHQSPFPPQTQAVEGSSQLIQQVLNKCSALVLRVEGLENANAAQQLEIIKLKARVKKLERLNKGRISVDIDEGVELVVDQEKDAEIEGRQADTQVEIYNIYLDHSSKVLSMQEDTEVQEAVEVVTTAKLMTEVVTAAATQTREEIEKEDDEIIKSINETPAQKAAK
nr:glutamic acid-rich protein-like [Tanacetum cinerariifolium]